MTIFNAWSYGLAGVAYTFFSLSLLKINFSHQNNRAVKPLVIAAVASTALWALFGFGYVFSTNVAWIQLNNLFDLLRYFSWCCYLLVLISKGDRHRKNAIDFLSIFVIFSLTLVLIYQSLTPIIESSLSPALNKRPQGLYRIGSLVYPLVSLILLEQIFFNASEDIRWRIKPLCLGLASAFVFDLYLFSQAALFGYVSQGALGVRGLVYSLILPMLWISLTRRNGNELKISISPSAVFHSATLLIAGIYLIFISGVGYYVRFFGGDWGQAFQLAIVFLLSLIFLVLFLSNSLRAKFRVFVSKNFFNYRFDYRDEWLNLTKVLAAKKTPTDMGKQVILGLASMMASPAGSLWTKKPDAHAFGQLAYWNHPHTDAKEDSISSFCEFIERTGWVVNLDEFRNFPSRYEFIKLPDWLLDFSNAWLLVPLMAGEDLIGFCVLDKSHQVIEVNWEVNDLLKVAGKQAGGYLAQMQATEAWLEVRKFDAFNRMSAFVVHDLKNIVTQLSLMMKNSKRFLENPEFQRDMLLTVENSLERMHQLMLQLREGTFHRNAMTSVNLSKVILRLVSVAEKNGRKLEVEIMAPAWVLASEERFERILGHLVQNAFDATPADGRVWLKLGHFCGRVQILIGDTGQGMSPEFMKNQLFKPFQSTKKYGLGIGAYEIFQYVRELGGEIEVQSELGKGTTVSILLPQPERSSNFPCHGLESV